MTGNGSAFVPSDSTHHPQGRAVEGTHWGSGTLRNACIAIVIALMTVGGGAATSAAAPTSAVLSVASDARSAQKQAIALRKDVKALLTNYTNEYADRFTAAELAQLNSYRDDADRQLASVVVTTSRLSRVAGKKSGKKAIDQAQSAALRSWTRAKGAAETSWEKARVIMEPKLGLLERLNALNDYNAMMTRFDTLGDTLRDLGT